MMIRCERHVKSIPIDEGSSLPTMSEMIVISAKDVARLLTYDACIEALRDAMQALSRGTTLQLLRAFMPLDQERMFAIMPGALGRQDYFGAKLISVFADPERPGRSAHRGVVALFDGKSGFPLCIADAEAVTLIRTASASALATKVLAREQASVLAIIGCGQQAAAHVEAISRVRQLRQIVVWGRSTVTATSFAERLAGTTRLSIRVANDIESAVREADIVCTVTASREPILKGTWLRAGTHVNLVGASGPTAAEADCELVRRSRYFVDSRQAALTQAGELLRAKESGTVDDGHIAGEIGEVLAGRCEGRLGNDEITVYKSLGHAVQDLAATAYVYQQLAQSN